MTLYHLKSFIPNMILIFKPGQYCGPYFKIVKENRSGGLNGYSLVSFLFKNLIVLALSVSFLLVCFVVSVYYS